MSYDGVGLLERIHVKRILRSNWAEQPPVRTPEKLWDRVLDAWEKMAKNIDLFHNFVDSMPRRMRADVDAGILHYHMMKDVDKASACRAENPCSSPDTDTDSCFTVLKLALLPDCGQNLDFKT
ncbi:hypothetical protein ANN_17168 [Periplaneta americana]|uniref:Uncharacterized protein n=1 Tax=Periplaneta americana TaxID=6978 RepID=A0ABQ8SS62_PERAM|nr:hypothetical protein ANN_17168 [Periplaneta americana]